jgi:long-chain fatty acid transport protein
MDFSGTARFILNQAGQQTADLLSMAIPDQTTGSVTIDLPWNLNFGVAFLGIEDLTLAADAYLAFFESYDRLTVTFSCVEEGTCSDTLNGDPIEKRWSQSWQFALGGEYRIQALSLRLGYGLVLSPVPPETYDPSLPDGTRNLFSVGAGWKGSFWKVDLGYMLARWQGIKDNDVGAGDSANPEGKANGTYRTTSHLLALTLSAWF